MVPATSNGHGLSGGVTRSQFYGGGTRASPLRGVIPAAMASSSALPGDTGSASRGQPAILLTTSCTTGWADWVHGELWLCPDGLLRISLGLATTIAKSSGGGAALAYERFSQESSPRYFDQDEIRELVSRKRTNVWVPCVQIREAALRKGFTASRLRMTLIDGRSVKFLWLPDGRTFAILRDRFAGANRTQRTNRLTGLLHKPSIA